MRIEHTQYRSWPEAYRCTDGPVELIAVTSIGPRILSLRLAGGENLLYEDDTDFRVGAWRLYGGHRFATSPETKASYTPDNESCQASVAGDRLLIRQGAAGGLLRGLEIGPSPNLSGFTIRHILRNAGQAPWHGAAWAITCVNPVGRVVIPSLAGRTRLWTQAGEHHADASSPQWRGADDHFVVEPNGEKGKVGLCSERAWLALLRPEFTFVIRGPEFVPHATYPDEGCNVEVYTCSRWMELETLGPLTTLEPGWELSHLERWQVLSETFTPLEWPLIDRFGQAPHLHQGIQSKPL